MNALRQSFSGLLFIGLALIIGIGGLTLSLTEGGLTRGRFVTSTATLILTPSPAHAIETTPSPAPSIYTPTPIISLTPSPPSDCPPPAGWVAVRVRPEEDLQTLSQRYNLSAEALRQANCLFNENLVAGALVYVPPQPSATPIPCGPPTGWVTIRIPGGVTLYRLSVLYRVSVSSLQKANCMGASTFIRAGSVFYVPNVPTSTATFTPTSTASATLPPSATPTSTATASVTLTFTPSPTTTPSATPDTTPTPTPEDTPSPTATLPPTATATP